MTVQLTQTNKKSNLTPAAEQTILRKREDDTPQEVHSQTDDALQMQSVYRASNGGVLPGSGYGDSSLNNSKLFDYLKVQPKLTIGAPNDKYEQETVQMSDRVMSMPAPTLKSFSNGRDDKGLRAKSMVQLQTEEEPQAKGDGTTEVNPGLPERISSTKGSGEPLGDSTSAFMEPRFGTDFSNVRVHTGSNAVSMSNELGAQAFTHGSDLYFNEGKYDPDTGSGKSLLAHELTHTVQQGAAVAQTFTKVDKSQEEDEKKDEVEVQAKRDTAYISSLPIGVQRGIWGSVKNSARAMWDATRSKSRCTTIGTRLTTKKVGNAPPGWYGANFNHTFHPLKTGCTLKGVEVSEVVSVNRDDFQTRMKNIPVGKTIWRLTSKHELHKPDSIHTQAGLKGLGVNPLLHWPAVLSQDQLWYYRFSSKSSWRLGPGIGIKVTLSGNMNNKNTLKVTTTDNGKSISEKYSGPNIRLVRPRRRIP
ncbi:MAG: DUF4157 domain-containing protein [Candidatus Scalindua sp.]|nr:DUF4157 domain-containing protein [Candidatus Scalindua sp.]